MKKHDEILHCAIHEHKHGKDHYIFRSDTDRTDFSMPYEEPESEILEIAKALDIDFKPEKGETLEVINFNNTDNIPTI